MLRFLLNIFSSSKVATLTPFSPFTIDRDLNKRDIAIPPHPSCLSHKHENTTLFTSYHLHYQYADQPNITVIFVQKVLCFDGVVRLWQKCDSRDRF